MAGGDEPQHVTSAAPKEVEQWRKDLDLAAFKKDIDDLGNTLRKAQGEADKEHLNKMITWQRCMLAVGLLSAWYCVNPVSVFLISAAVMVRWTMIGHHVCHGGYDRCGDKRYNKNTFALGARRALDWLDWMLPEAWNHEHNRLHHYQLGEDEDPDLVERNMEWLRDAQWPTPVKYMAVGFFMLTWKWFYYAPNTLKELKRARVTRSGGVIRQAWLESVTMASTYSAGLLPEVFLSCILPFALYQFVVLPMPAYLLLGRAAYINTMINLVLAELLTNAHSFLVIVTNHAGNDLYRFSTPCTARSGDFYLRQVISSADFATGGDFNDLMHGFLNYQIEHHLWPDLSMLQYQRSQPLVKDLCAKHNVPYVQESVFKRLKKTVDIMVGAASMKRW